jgi:hypothetical protein
MISILKENKGVQLTTSGVLCSIGNNCCRLGQNVRCDALPIQKNNGQRAADSRVKRSTALFPTAVRCECLQYKGSLTLE